MINIYQTTLVKPLKFKGKGLHTGLEVEMKVLPADSNQGIIFKRIDLKKNNIINANYLNVSSAKLCTTLENSTGAKVSTVEHLLAALYIAEIDNAIIEINSPEVPIMDGSAKSFLDALKHSKIKTLSEKRKFLKFLKKLEYKDGKKTISIEPNEDSFEVEFQLNYDNKLIGDQKNTVNFQKDSLDEVIESRTFCLFKDIEKIKRIGLAKGGSLENAIIVDDDKVLNDGGLRNKKEFVNHKILDLAGDFLLSGYRVLGKVTCNQGGHELTNLFLKKVFKIKNAFVINEIKNINFSNKIKLNYIEKLAVNG